MSYEMIKYLINVVNEFDFMQNSSVFCFVKMKAHSLISEYIQIILPVKPRFKVFFLIQGLRMLKVLHCNVRKSKRLSLLI